MNRIAARFLGVQNRHSKPLPRGHKALESLKGPGPSAQTVAIPAQSIRVPDHHPATSMHAGANPPPHNAANHRRDPAANSQHRIPASANPSPEINGFTTSQVSSFHSSPSQQATNAVAGPSRSQAHTAASLNMHLHPYGYQDDYFTPQGMSPSDSARYDRTPFGGIKKSKSKRK